MNVPSNVVIKDGWKIGWQGWLEKVHFLTPHGNTTQMAEVILSPLLMPWVSFKKWWWPQKTFPSKILNYDKHCLKCFIQIGKI